MRNTTTGPMLAPIVDDVDEDEGFKLSPTNKNVGMKTEYGNFNAFQKAPERTGSAAP